MMMMMQTARHATSLKHCTLIHIMLALLALPVGSSCGSGKPHTGKLLLLMLMQTASTARHAVSSTLYTNVVLLAGHTLQGVMTSPAASSSRPQHVFWCIANTVLTQRAAAADKCSPSCVSLHAVSPGVCAAAAKEWQGTSREAAVAIAIHAVTPNPFTLNSCMYDLWCSSC